MPTDRSGRCVFCGCTYMSPCPQGCGWQDRFQTVCTACVDVRNGWLKLPAKDSAFRRSFFRGFAAAVDDERASERKNPYAVAQTLRARQNHRRLYWTAGYEFGLAAAAREVARA